MGLINEDAMSQFQRDMIQEERNIISRLARNEARDLAAHAKVKPDMGEYRSARQNGDNPVKAMRSAIGKAEDMAYARRQQKKAQEKFSLQLDILANAVADLTSDDPKVASEARKTLKDHTDGYWRTLVILNSSDMADLMGDGD